MQAIVQKLKEKQDLHRKKLKIYSILDNVFSFVIILLNVSSIALAIWALVKLVLISKKEHITNQSLSFILLITFVVLLIISFLLTIFLAIYKHNTKNSEYHKVLNTLNYINDKYKAKKLSDTDLNIILDALWEKISLKQKLTIKKILKKELKSTNKVGK
ncbi:hypothetical protein RRG51_01935 [Mycoplasmopsis cynos]|uniref:hypothetical protein n=1 Tax=Mycoplasmopsis cynos TaxID=171284 RepID=UPI002AFFF1CE|nr:hypothetical protein [Mycoplasmopsis cynos]WQQ16500.1 hypothetical protein RRG51_01935 [Mycoplasmopsis cynos]